MDLSSAGVPSRRTPDGLPLWPAHGSAGGGSRLALAVAILIALAALAGCEKQNASFCCSDEASCKEFGEEVTPCGTGKVCDDDGTMGGTRHTCVDEPPRPPCTVDAECAAVAGKPVCIDQVCVECRETSQCGVGNPVCQASHACGDCAAEQDCTRFADTRHCSTQSGACVGCRDAADCPSVTAPVCTAAGTCAPCTADDQCASQVCLRATGECIAENRIIYVAGTNGAAGNCTKAAPCKTIGQGVAALAAGRDYIRLRPVAAEYAEAVVLDNKPTAIIDGDEKVHWQPGAADTPSVTVRGGSTVTLRGLRISGGVNDGVGVACAEGIGPSTINLERVSIDNNVGGGVRISGCNFTIVNSFIVSNGRAKNGPDAGSTFGGLALSNLTGATQVRRIEHSTITNNRSDDGVGGVVCNLITAPVTVVSSILFGNTGADQITDNANCGDRVTYSIVNPNPNPGTDPHNKTSDPRFVSASNFHIQPGSPAIDAADPASASRVKLDFDLQARPQGAASDIGADELAP